MPLDKPGLLGTEMDGTRSREYCTYCYRDGAFINPDMTLAEMKIRVKSQMEKMKMNTGIIEVTLNSLRSLKRWKAAVTSA